jgi:hypothetical protein
MTVAGAQLVDGSCPDCRDDDRRPAFRASEGPFGSEPGSRIRVSFGARHRRGQAEADLRWYYTQAEGELGLRAISIASDLLAPTSERMRREDNGVWRAKPTRVVVVRGMTVGQIMAAKRCRRIVRALGRIAQKHARVLQRRFDLIYYPELDVLFGEWSGLVDYLTPEVSAMCRPREGKKPSEAVTQNYLTTARTMYDLALAAYIRASEAT